MSTPITTPQPAAQHAQRPKRRVPVIIEVAAAVILGVALVASGFWLGTESASSPARHAQPVIEKTIELPRLAGPILEKSA